MERRSTPGRATAAVAIAAVVTLLAGACSGPAAYRQGQRIGNGDAHQVDAIASIGDGLVAFLDTAEVVTSHDGAKWELRGAGAAVLRGARIHVARRTAFG